MSDAAAVGADTPADTIAEALRQLGDGPPEEPVTIGQLVAQLDARAQSLVLLLLAAPNLTPGPSMPGFSTIFGVPVCIVAFEMMLGRPHLRLPGFIARRPYTRGRVAAFVARLTPLLRRFEAVLKPRLPELAGSRRLVGTVCFVLGLLLLFPIPVFSLLPAFVILVIALGRLAQDGLVIAVGLGLTVLTLVLFAAVVWLGVEAFT
jgi:hypothetical protein